ncbi:hypothetical protein LCGC14_0375780 [marine sediment metagenome]|uniref:Uncharacterized protein n=1 Tax=marine sediment metagenome TaxID=412755 RepID=A0A0F9T3N9_9ZZZZ
MDRVNTKTHCRYCTEELTIDKKRNCKVCLSCNPPRANVAPPPKSKNNFIDVKVTEERVREIFKELFSGDAVRLIVRDELENWHIQRPPVTKKDSVELTVEKLQEVAKEIKSHEATGNFEISVSQEMFNDSNWRAKAKELGIPLFQRTKQDVLKDIEAKLAAVNV